MQQKKIFIIVGEASGDLLGSKIINAIKQNAENIAFVGIGGEKMEKENFKSIFPMKDLSVMGFFEVLYELVALSHCFSHFTVPFL